MLDQINISFKMYPWVSFGNNLVSMIFIIKFTCYLLPTKAFLNQIIFEKISNLVLNLEFN